MLNRLWQRCMIGLARSRFAKRLFTSIAGNTRLARRFVAVGSTDDAARRMAEMKRECGAVASLFYLGEYVYDKAAVDQSVDAQKQAIAALAKEGLELHVSADPTQIGLMLNPETAAENAEHLGVAIRECAAGSCGRPFLMIDMEDHTTVQETWELYQRLLKAGVPAAITLQVYLKRTEDDLRSLLGGRNAVRLVKGAFVAGAEVAYTSKSAVLENYRKLIALMFSPEARRAGFYPIVATHDAAIHEYTIELAAANGWRPEEWEFECLLGIAEQRTRALLGRGYKVRVYAPFGEDWWPYAIRRVGEHPHLLKLLFVR